MDAEHYIEGTPLKVRMLHPDDLVWTGTKVRRVTEIRPGWADWYTVVFDDGHRLKLGGNKALFRAQKRVDLPRTVNVVEQQTLIVDLRIEIIELKIKVEARELELAELEEQHEHDLARIKVLERDLEQYRKVGNARSHELIDADNRARNLEKQIRAQDKALRTQHDHIGELRAALDTIEQAATSARR